MSKISRIAPTLLALIGKPCPDASSGTGFAHSLTGLPKFRVAYSNSAYAEGWAVYAEQLGKEAGFYQDPVSDYGRLAAELQSAKWLVVDTGRHAQGWTRDQALAVINSEADVDRYIASPGQTLSYMLGEQKFLELRARAQKELGAKFDLRTFHDEMLNEGSLPLDMLDARTNSWIAAQKGANTTAAITP
jgi:uncharacterized protein (DUF885 family)